MCVRLAAELGETVNIAVLQEHYAVNVDQARGPSDRGHAQLDRPADPAALHVQRQGADRPPRPRDAAPELLAASGMPRSTPRTVTRAGRLDARSWPGCASAGYAVAVEEYELGLNAVAAPVHDQSGQVIAAVSVSGPVLPAEPSRGPTSWSPRSGRRRRDQPPDGLPRLRPRSTPSPAPNGANGTFAREVRAKVPVTPRGPRGSGPDAVVQPDELQVLLVLVEHVVDQLGMAVVHDVVLLAVVVEEDLEPGVVVVAL